MVLIGLLRQRNCKFQKRFQNLRKPSEGKPVCRRKAKRRLPLATPVGREVSNRTELKCALLSPLLLPLDPKTS